MTDAIVADANPLLSALLGGRARDILFSRKLVFYSPQHTLFEVEKYIEVCLVTVNCSHLLGNTIQWVYTGGESGAAYFRTLLD